MTINLRCALPSVGFLLMLRRGNSSVLILLVADILYKLRYGTASYRCCVYGSIRSG